MQEILSAGSPYSTASEYNNTWAHYAPSAMANPVQELYAPRPSPVVTSSETWSTGFVQAMMSPVSATTGPQNFWYPQAKAYVPPASTSIDMGYQLELQTMLPTVSESVSPYVPYATTEWDHASIASLTPAGIKDPSTSPVSVLDSQPLSASLNIHAKQSYIDAFWEYFHPLFPILHKPTMEQQRQSTQQSPSGLLLKAAIVMCGATLSREDSRWWDGKLLMRKCLQHMVQVSCEFFCLCSPAYRPS
jgi:hypothetical protein